MLMTYCILFTITITEMQFLKLVGFNESLNDFVGNHIHILKLTVFLYTTLLLYHTPNFKSQLAGKVF